MVCIVQLYLLSFQVVHYHVPPDGDPAPSEPDHLALVALGHRTASSQPLVDGVDEEQSVRRAPALLRGCPARRRHLAEVAQRAQEHRHGRIEDTRVFAEDVRAREGVQRHGARVPALAFHQRPQESDCAVVQGSVVGVVTDAMLVKGQDHIDGRVRGPIGTAVLFWSSCISRRRQ